jgi:hypothetical protein
MTERRLAEIENYQGLVDALRRRVAELNTTFESVGELALQPARYVNKLLAPKPKKVFGEQSLDSIMSALAVRLIMVEDTEQLDRIRHRLDERSTLGNRVESSVTFSFSRRHFARIGSLGGLARKPPSVARMRRLGKLGGRARMDALSPQMRSKLSRKGHEARWGAKRGIVSSGIADTEQTPMNSA